jgi:SAM-dependent methyltransferase
MPAEPKFEAVACDGCGARGGKVLYRFNFGGEAANILECDRCCHAYLSPRPRLPCVADFYGENYYSFSIDPLAGANIRNAKGSLRLTVMRHHFGYRNINVSDTWPIPAAVSALFKAFVAVPHYRENGRLLDIGCGAGQKLVEFKSLGWKVRGIELSPKAAAAGQSIGLEIVTTLAEAPWPAGYFTAITFYHSLEHLPSPLTALREAYRLMDTGGELLVVVPNFGCLERKLFGERWGWLDVPVHFHHFTKATLTRIVTEAGFRIEAIGFSPIGSSAELRFFNRVPLVRTLSDKALRLFGFACAAAGSGKALIVSARKCEGAPLSDRSQLQSLPHGQ